MEVSAAVGVVSLAPVLLVVSWGCDGAVAVTAAEEESVGEMVGVESTVACVSPLLASPPS